MTFPVTLLNVAAAVAVTVTLNWHWLFTAMLAARKRNRVAAARSQRSAACEARLISHSQTRRQHIRESHSGLSHCVSRRIGDREGQRSVASDLHRRIAKALEMEGGATTLTLAEAVVPLPPSVEVTLPVTLFWTPAAVPVTFTENEQGVPGARAAPERLTTPVPAVAVIVPPPQDPLNPLGVETVSPAGSVSLKPMPCSVVPELIFARLKVKLVEPFSGIVAAPNDLVKFAGGAITVTDAVDVFPVPAFAEVT